MDMNTCEYSTVNLYRQFLLELSEIGDDTLGEMVLSRRNFEREQTTTFVVSRSILKTENARCSRERGAGREKERESARVRARQRERERERMKEEGEKAGRWNGIQQSVRHSASRIASFRRYKSRPFAQEYIRETPSASSSSCRVPSLLSGSDRARCADRLSSRMILPYLPPLVSFEMTFCFLSY